jgi:hypothetical protein
MYLVEIGEPTTVAVCKKKSSNDGTCPREVVQGRLGVEEEKKIQAKSPINTAPTRPATLKSIALTDRAPDLGVVVVVPVLAPPEVVGDVLGVVVGVVAVVGEVIGVVRAVVGEVTGVVTRVVVVPPVVAPVVVVALRQAVLPGCIVNAADWAVKPELSFKVRPIEVPGVILTIHV